MVQIGPNWSKLLKIGTKWSKMVQNGPNWSKLVQNGKNRSKLVQIGTNWSKVYSILVHALTDFGIPVGYRGVSVKVERRNMNSRDTWRILWNLTVLQKKRQSFFETICQWDGSVQYEVPPCQFVESVKISRWSTHTLTHTYTHLHTLTLTTQRQIVSKRISSTAWLYQWYLTMLFTASTIDSTRV